MPGQPDDTLDAFAGVMNALSGLVGSVSVITTDVGYLKRQLDDNGRKIDEALKTINTIMSDASASPAGRELLRRIAASEKVQDAHEQRLDDLDDFRTEVRGGMKVLRAQAAIATALAAVVSIVWTLHLFGVGP